MLLREMAPHRLTLFALAALHLAAGAMLAWSIDAGVGSPVVEVLLDALVYADAGLLAVWAGLGRHSKWAGFFGVGLGMACLAGFVAWALRHSMSGLTGPGNDFWTTVWLWLFQLALALLSMAVVLAVLLRLRQRGFVLQRARRAEAIVQSAEVQFSLRQLMLLVFFVAALVKLGPSRHDHTDWALGRAGPTRHRGPRRRGARSCGVVRLASALLFSRLIQRRLCRLSRRLRHSGGHHGRLASGSTLAGLPASADGRSVLKSVKMAKKA